MPRSSEGVSCDEAGCVAQMAGGGLVALALRPDALADDCERAALMVTARQVPPACGALCGRSGASAEAGRAGAAAKP